jgi:hypothetical protein
MLQTSDSVWHVGVIPIATAIARKRIPLAVFHEAISLHGLDTRDHHASYGGENRDGAFAEIHWFRPPGVIVPERAGNPQAA